LILIREMVIRLIQQHDLHQKADLKQDTSLIRVQSKPLSVLR
jgi:hypothetical protein